MICYPGGPWFFIQTEYLRCGKYTAGEEIDSLVRDIFGVISKGGQRGELVRKEVALEDMRTWKQS